MNIYVTPAFLKLCIKENISIEDLQEAIARAERNQIDGPLGGYLIKQRIARQGQGRSSGFRTIIFYKRGEVALFLHMFAKSERANLSKKDQVAYYDYAEHLAKHTDEQFSRLVIERGWRQIKDEQPEEDVPK